MCMVAVQNKTPRFRNPVVETTKYHRVPQCMSPSWNWDSPNPSLAIESAPPPEPKGGGAHSPAGEEVGESQFRRLEKKLSTLPTLWLRRRERKCRTLISEL